MLKGIIIEVPLPQIAILVGVCTVFALMLRLKLVLICIYGFVLYWVFLLNEDKFGIFAEANLVHTGLFILASIIFVGCSAWVLFMER